VATQLLNGQNGSGMSHCTAGRQCFACMLLATDIPKCGMLMCTDTYF